MNIGRGRLYGMNQPTVPANTEMCLVAEVPRITLPDLMESAYPRKNK